ncbi:uncharacterized protein MYCFIDRAFT_173591 [Pseudocercospora fijiensis CIRAD86]|uniref:Uncharacterized protein n=1 Tax=Pseudocercospora fijiensis (strain CIRAD86) TaxID=383855 RepID=M3B5K5_PSEFD|nr:uncharacterized protein MYCFIDRAFT_173591 [Pseudocercospora fijiensis CIRAD86]EME84642.1 hypothetical protein MYCFIDRAFT_173591 [Pseudocercospora fijiensis CIRAD86]
MLVKVHVQERGVNGDAEDMREELKRRASLAFIRKVTSMKDPSSTRQEMMASNSISAPLRSVRSPTDIDIRRPPPTAHRPPPTADGNHSNMNMSLLAQIYHTHSLPDSLAVPSPVWRPWTDPRCLTVSKHGIVLRQTLLLFRVIDPDMARAEPLAVAMHGNVECHGTHLLTYWLNILLLHDCTAFLHYVAKMGRDDYVPVIQEEPSSQYLRTWTGHPPHRRIAAALIHQRINMGTTCHLSTMKSTPIIPYFYLPYKIWIH